MSTSLDDLDNRNGPGYGGGEMQGGGGDLASQILSQIEVEESGGAYGGASGGRWRNQWGEIGEAAFTKAMWSYSIVLILFLLVTHPFMTRILAKLMGGSHLFHSYGRWMVRIVQGSILAFIYIIATARN